MRKKYLLKVENLGCERDYKPIFNKLSFALRPGNIILIDGDNGSGKTSLLLCVANILYYTGYVHINNDISNLGYVGHKNALCENETIEEFITFWKKIYNFDKNHQSILESFNLGNFNNTPVGFLSFGQKKKLSFIRLIMMKAKIWLLDEPISGLDKKTKKIIINLIKEHLAKGGGVIATSHQSFNHFGNNKTKRLNIG